MGCDKYIERISAALDGELTAEERRELDGHLSACPHCAALFEELGGQSRALRELEAPFPAGLHDRIMNNLPPQEAPAKKNNVIHWKRWGTLAACLVLVAVAALAVPRGQVASEEALAPAAEAPAEYAGSTKTDAAHESANGYSGMDESKTVSIDSFDLADALRESLESSTDGALSWAKVQYLRVGYGYTPSAPSAVVISTADSLADYLSGYGTNRFDEDMNPIPIPELEALPGFYTEDFFTDRCLLMVLVTEGSGSISHEILSVTADTVTVRRIVPEMGTCDMAAWLMVIEVDDMLDDGSVLTVEFTK